MGEREERSRFGFEHAIYLLKQGEYVCREGWNGKDIYVFLQPESIRRNDNIPNLPFLAMKTADHKVVPWAASQTDMLADDWMVYYTNGPKEASGVTGSKVNPSEPRMYGSEESRRVNEEKAEELRKDHKEAMEYILRESSGSKINPEVDPTYNISKEAEVTSRKDYELSRAREKEKEDRFRNDIRNLTGHFKRKFGNDDAIVIVVHDH